MNISVKILIILILVTNLSFYSLKSQDFEKNVKHFIRRANIVYNKDSIEKGHPHIPPLVSNGIIGGCFDHMGFQHRPSHDYPEGRTVLGYIDNYYRHSSSRQIQCPLGNIEARFADGTSIQNLIDAKGYKQELDLYTGVLKTSYDLYGQTEIMTFAHQTIPNLMILKIDRKRTSPKKDIVLHIDCEPSDEQNNRLDWKTQPLECKFNITKKGIDIETSTNLTTTKWHIMTQNPVEVNGNQITIHLEQERNILRIFVDRNDCPGLKEIEKPYETLLALHEKEWQKIWETSWVNFPEDRAQNIWTRMKYYAISHFPLIPEKPLIPTGLNSNIWGFTFPQDVYYVADNLPRLGHFNRSEKALKYWLDVLPDVKNYSRRIMGIDGGFYPWTPPFEDWDSYEKNGVVSPDSYELHNPAYVAAMVWHYYQISGDNSFLEEYFPVLEEVWRFYTNISEKNEHGTFDVYHKNARGQDEASSTEGNLRNLLCASYSAEYTARNYLKATVVVADFDRELKKHAKTILKTGYERESLRGAHGWYVTYEGDDRPLNEQKHPVQLNPVTYVPMPDLVYEDSPVIKSWNNRYELTEQAKKPITKGWTFGQFSWTSCRMRAPRELEQDLWAIQACRGADPRWIQFYESSFWTGWHLNKAYYFPMMGLYLQTFTDALVQDWRGYIDLFPCLLTGWEAEKISFHGIYTKNGVKVSGSWDNGQFNVTLTPTYAKKIKLRVSRELNDIRIYGQDKGPDIINGNVLYDFSFREDEPIVITYKK
jgi:hypothetical protein